MIFSREIGRGGLKSIAIKSPERGLGTTHISLCLANALAMSGKKVAVIEWNSHRDFAEIEKAFCGFGYEEGDEKFFRIRRVDYYKNYQEKGLAGLKKENYEIIIADIGNHQNHYFAEADIPILVVSGSEWRAGKMLPAIRENEDAVGRRMRIVVNFASPEEIRFFRKKSAAKCYGFPFWKDAFASSKEQRQQVLQLLV